MRQFENYLITGGAGFIGANFIKNFFEQHPSAKIINLDALTYAGSLENTKSFSSNPNYTFCKVDISDYQGVKSVFESFDIDCIIHFAAESHVDRSIENPRAFIDTNIIGTYNLLEHAKHAWGDMLSDKLFYHVSTDEVYGTLGPTGYFFEDTAYNPQSPYSASKASSDHLVRAYANTYKLPTIISNCSNNYGPLQHEEKLIPVVIKKVLNNQPIPVYGTGENVRDWLFVTDHCKAILSLVQKGSIQNTYNIGGNNEITNIKLVNHICERIAIKRNVEKNTYKSLIGFVEDRKGHDFRYAINCDKIQQELFWEPNTGFEEGIDATIDWYLHQWS